MSNNLDSSIRHKIIEKISEAQEEIFIEKKEQEDCDKAYDIDNDCSICYEVMKKINVSVTECGHTFHTSCLLKAAIIKNECPYCRARLFEQVNVNVSVSVSVSAPVISPEVVQPLSVRDPDTWNQIAERLNALERRAAVSSSY
jgi:hypothetical protein